MIRRLTNITIVIVCSAYFAACSSTQEERTESRSIESVTEGSAKEATAVLFRFCWETTDDQRAAIPKLLAEGFVETTTAQQRQNISRFFQKGKTTVILSNPFASVKLQRCTVRVIGLASSADFSRQVIEELKNRELQYQVTSVQRGTYLHRIPSAKKQIATAEDSIGILREGLVF